VDHRALVAELRIQWALPQCRIRWALLQCHIQWAAARRGSAEAVCRISAEVRRLLAYRTSAACSTLAECLIPGARA
jgi:hypothetical protein